MTCQVSVAQFYLVPREICFSIILGFRAHKNTTHQYIHTQTVDGPHFENRTRDRVWWIERVLEKSDNFPLQEERVADADWAEMAGMSKKVRNYCCYCCYCYSFILNIVITQARLVSNGLIWSLQLSCCNSDPYRGGILKLNFIMGPFVTHYHSSI